MRGMEILSEANSNSEFDYISMISLLITNTSVNGI